MNSSIENPVSKENLKNHKKSFGKVVKPEVENQWNLLPDSFKLQVVEKFNKHLKGEMVKGYKYFIGGKWMTYDHQEKEGNPVFRITSHNYKALDRNSVEFQEFLKEFEKLER